MNVINYCTKANISSDGYILNAYINNEDDKATEMHFLWIWAFDAYD